jgi:Phage gp6-like head-tail connector protein
VADLTTVANAKLWLGVVSATDDTLLARLVSGVSAWIQEWLGRTIASQSYTETLNGNGRDVLVFLRYPVTAVTSVTIDTVAIPPRSAPGQAGYFFDSDFLYLDGGYFFTKNSKQNVVIVYTAGFATTPLDLEQAAIELIALRYKDKDRIGVTAKSIGNEHVTFFSKDFPDDVESVLWSYKRVVPTS